MLHHPRYPELDGERWFKLTLATLLRGRVEAAGGDAAAWEDAVRRWVPYHPAGRLPERKITNPAAPTLPGAPLDGERELLDALLAESEPVERWAVLYDRDEAVLGDPNDLGARYDLGRVLGAGPGWDPVAALADPAAGLARVVERLGARWALVSDPDASAPDVIGALAAELDAVEVPWPPDADAEAAAEAIGDALEAAAPEYGSRLIVAASGRAITPVLRALCERPDLRDRVYAVVSAGGAIGGLTSRDDAYGPSACEDWLGRWFTQGHLDTDVVRRTPYMALQWLDRAAWPPGIRDLPLARSRFPEPLDDTSGVLTVESVDLGPLPARPDLPLDLVARALVLVVAAWVESRT